MREQMIILSSMAMDLKRVALGLHRNSLSMAERFEEEVLKREQQIDKSLIKPYLRYVLKDLKLSLKGEDRQKKAEDVLMYSTLIQNYVLKNYQT